MNIGTLAPIVASLVQPAINALAARLFVLSTWRDGSREWKPTVASFYETGLVTSLYEQLLMSPALAHLEIRHEMAYPGRTGAPQQVDLWLRNLVGGRPMLIKAGDFAAPKVHRDIEKIRRLEPSGQNWFLAFFRENEINAARSRREAEDPFAALRRSGELPRSGLDLNRVEFDSRLTGSFKIYRPDGNHDPFGYALIKAR